MRGVEKSNTLVFARLKRVYDQQTFWNDMLYSTGNFSGAEPEVRGNGVAKVDDKQMNI